MLSKKEILERMEKAQSWREAQLDIKEVLNVFSREDNNAATATNEIAELREKINKLTENNKQLRAENKALKSR